MHKRFSKNISIASKQLVFSLYYIRQEQRVSVWFDFPSDITSFKWTFTDMRESLEIDNNLTNISSGTNENYLSIQINWTQWKHRYLIQSAPRVSVITFPGCAHILQIRKTKRPSLHMLVEIQVLTWHMHKRYEEVKPVDGTPNLLL